MTDFSGKNILVVGGSRGIGAAIVRRFARAGGAVAFSCTGSSDAARARGGNRLGGDPVGCVEP